MAGLARNPIWNSFLERYALVGDVYGLSPMNTQGAVLIAAIGLLFVVGWLIGRVQARRLKQEAVQAMKMDPGV